MTKRQEANKVQMMVRLFAFQTTEALQAKLAENAQATERVAQTPSMWTEENVAYLRMEKAAIEQALASE